MDWIRFIWPGAWVLLIPAAALLWRLARGWGRATAVLRVVVVVLLIAVLAGVQLRLGGQGTDVLILVDRSASMTAEDQKECRELIGTIAAQRGAGDRVGVVAFGQKAHSEWTLSESGEYGGPTSDVGADGSNLAGGLDMAFALVNRDRPTRIIVLGDGESTGPSPLPAARRAAAGGVPIDYRLFEHPDTGDVSIASMELPAKVDQNEQFQFSALVHSDRATKINYTLTRPGSEPIRGERTVRAGVNRLIFRDTLNTRGVVGYELTIDGPKGDQPGNNTARGVLHVQAPPAILLVNNSGQADNVARALGAGEMKVDVAAVEKADLSLERLAGYRGVILENVSANDVGSPAMRALASFVKDLGGGLMMTGGQRSFGAGGYYLSDLEPVLPVTMELRKEHRKLTVALAIVMDRSGSMGMPVDGGKTKMDLANLAAAEAVKLLSDQDSVAVIPVDSSAHVSVPLTSASKRDEIVTKIKRIESMGGGIFVYVGLAAGGEQLEKAGQATRHMILFADTQDSEEPGRYKELLERFEKMGITVSVIGLGKNTPDSDGKLLEDIAKRGHGQIFFTEDAKDLPRLFSQDTMSVARNTFIPDPVGTKTLTGLRMLGDYGGPAMGRIGGYNLAYLRPRATMGVRTEDEYAAPVVGLWQYGLGRALAATFEADGKHTGDLVTWPGYAEFFVTAGRWLLGAGEPDGMLVRMDRRGSTGIVRLEVDPERVGAESIAPVAHVVTPGDTARRTIELPLRWISDSVAEAAFDLDQTGSFQAVIDAGGGRVLKSGALCLPYSPEFAPRLDEPDGREVLDSVATISGGQSRLSMAELFTPTGRQRRWATLSPILLLAALLLALTEIAGRRLMLWNAAAFAWVGRNVRIAWSRLPRPRLPKLRLQRRPAIPRQPTEPAAADAPPEAPAEPAAPAPPKKSALDRAKRQAKRRYGR